MKHPIPCTVMKLSSFFDKKPAQRDERGRVRNKEHVPGNWATLIYIPGKRACLRMAN